MQTLNWMLCWRCRVLNCRVLCCSGSLMVLIMIKMKLQLNYIHRCESSSTDIRFEVYLLTVELSEGLILEFIDCIKCMKMEFEDWLPMFSFLSKRVILGTEFISMQLCHGLSHSIPDSSSSCFPFPFLVPLWSIINMSLYKLLSQQSVSGWGQNAERLKL